MFESQKEIWKFNSQFDVIRYNWYEKWKGETYQLCFITHTFIMRRKLKPRIKPSNWYRRKCLTYITLQDNRNSLTSEYMQGSMCIAQTWINNINREDRPIRSKLKAIMVFIMGTQDEGHASLKAGERIHETAHSPSSQKSKRWRLFYPSANLTPNPKTQAE